MYCDHCGLLLYIDITDDIAKNNIIGSRFKMPFAAKIGTMGQQIRGDDPIQWTAPMDMCQTLRSLETLGQTKVVWIVKVYTHLPGMFNAYQDMTIQTNKCWFMLILSTIGDHQTKTSATWEVCSVCRCSRWPCWPFPEELHYPVHWNSWNPSVVVCCEQSHGMYRKTGKVEWAGCIFPSDHPSWEWPPFPSRLRRELEWLRRYGKALPVGGSPLILYRNKPVEMGLVL